MRESGDIAENLYGEGSAKEPRKMGRVLQQRSRLKKMIKKSGESNSDWASHS